MYQNGIHIILLVILFILLAALPVVIIRYLKAIMQHQTKQTIGHTAFFSVLLFVVALCCVPMMHLLRAVHLAMINLVALPVIPWLIRYRMQKVEQGDADRFSFVYYLLFGIILIFLFITMFFMIDVPGAMLLS